MSAALAKTDYPLCAERFIVLLKAENQWRKLFSVQFERGRNGIGYFVHLPYFAHSQGILRGFDFDVPPGTSAQINFTEGGVTTTERLKYAHHSDGNAHFSQDGKAFTTIRSRTPPLQKHSPHLFTLNFWGADSFKVARDVDLKARTANRAAVGFVAPNQDLPASDVAARIVGRRFSISRLRQHSSVARGMNYAEPIGLLADGQQPLLGLMLQPRDLRPSDFMIFLSYVPMPRESSGEAAMVCIGGFHEAGPRSNPSSAVGGIAIFYADRGANWNNLVEQLGTIDFKERAEAGSGALAVTRGDAVQPIARVDDPVPVDEK